MTTIAWDGKTLAADRQSTWGNTPRPLHPNERKIARRSDYLLGAVGTGAEASTILATYPPDWAGVLALKRSDWVYGDDVAVLLIHANGVYVMRKEGLACVGVHSSQWSDGSGCNYALGAMLAGADARRAIEIASELDTGTGLGIDAIDWEPTP